MRKTKMLSPTASAAAATRANTDADLSQSVTLRRVLLTPRRNNDILLLVCSARFFSISTHFLPFFLFSTLLRSHLLKLIFTFVL